MGIANVGAQTAEATTETQRDGAPPVQSGHQQRAAHRTRRHSHKLPVVGNGNKTRLKQTNTMSACMTNGRRPFVNGPQGRRR